MIVIFIIAILTCINYNGFPQIGVAINTTGTSADSSAILDLSSKNSGFLLLRLSTAEHNAIINPVEVLQSWIGENINYNSTNSWCYYNDLGNCSIYGRLYTWDAVMNGSLNSISTSSGVQEICLLGWCLPSYVEWQQLELYFGMDPNVIYNLIWCGNGKGGMLKETGTLHWLYPNTGANNLSGFTALPGGYPNPNGDFLEKNSFGHWWTDRTATSRSLVYNLSSIGRGINNKYYGYVC